MCHVNCVERKKTAFAVFLSKFYWIIGLAVSKNDKTSFLYAFKGIVAYFRNLLGLRIIASINTAINPKPMAQHIRITVIGNHVKTTIKTENI